MHENNRVIRFIASLILVGIIIVFIVPLMFLWIICYLLRLTPITELNKKDKIDGGNNNE